MPTPTRATPPSPPGAAARAAMLGYDDNEEPTRREVRDADWANELHVTDRCYKRIAQRFQDAIRSATPAL
ncbi:MAG: hypothetical protein U0638_11860 [Phycisphaerales bacterium]